jgi:hypothetical protein
MLTQAIADIVTKRFRELQNGATNEGGKPEGGKPLHPEAERLGSLFVLLNWRTFSAPPHVSLTPEGGCRVRWFVDGLAITTDFTPPTH